MTIYAHPGAEFTAESNGPATGLVGTMLAGVFKKPGNVEVSALSTAGITEEPAGSQQYIAVRTAPTSPAGDGFAYVVRWDRGNGSIREEALVVTASVSVVLVSPSSNDTYTDVTAVRQILSPDGSTDPTLGTAASLSDAEIQEAINEAASEINARVAGRYTVPFAQAPAIIEKLNRDIAAYLATLVYRRGDPIDPNDPVQLRYNRAQTLLAAIQNGKAELVGAAGPVAEGTAEAEVINPYFGDLFLPADFNLGPAPYRGIGLPVPGYDDDGLL